jgi:phosphatidylglycerol:prolipoprotein diacylglycerol transferase
VAQFERAAFWIVVWGFVGARLFELAYDPKPYLADPWEMLRVWHGGLSSFGGFIGATIAFLWFVRRGTLPLWKSADALVRALPLALGCGRIGCFLIHDHPGTLAYGIGKWLAVRYPDGPRYDLGMLLGIFDFLMFGLFVWWSKKHRLADGAYLVMFLVIYAPVRFLLDFLRVVDARYWGLTPAQYGCVILFGLGVYLAGNRSKLTSK